MFYTWAHKLTLYSAYTLSEPKDVFLKLWGGSNSCWANKI